MEAQPVDEMWGNRYLHSIYHLTDHLLIKIGEKENVL